MSKPKKDKKPRPSKYAGKVAINMDFEQAIRFLADKANRVVNDSVNEPTINEPVISEPEQM